MSTNQDNVDEEATREEESPGMFQKIQDLFKGNWKKFMFLMILINLSQVFLGPIIYSKLFPNGPPWVPQSQKADPSVIQGLKDISSSKRYHNPIFHRGMRLYFRCYLDNSPDFGLNKENRDDFFWAGSFINGYSELNHQIFHQNITIDDPFFSPFYTSLLANHSLYLHMYVYPTNQYNENHPRSQHLVTEITYLFEELVVEKRNLISSTRNLLEETKDVKKAPRRIEWNLYYPKVMYIDLVDLYPSSLPVSYATQVTPYFKDLKFNENYDYYPVIIFNKFWDIRKYMYKITNRKPLEELPDSEIPDPSSDDRLFRFGEVPETLPLRIEINSMGMTKYSLYKQMESSFSFQDDYLGGGRKAKTSIREDIVDMVVGTNLLLLGVTVVVTLLHSVFDILAFKNDISFWKNKKSMHGISIKSMVYNFFSQFIILLYLWDNETSWMVIISLVLGTILEGWKITKAMNIQFGFGFKYFVRIGYRPSYEKGKTKEYDEQAMTYLYYILLPLLIIYSVYSLVYKQHKSVYSYIIKTLVGFIYAFAFIMMTPQLFINYKLKSVAHMNGRTMTYKVLNTFIDDLFAFVIKAPILHKIATLRDDIVFFVYLYQRYAYRVDHSRVNEFGQVSELKEEEEVEEEKESKKEK